MNTTGIILSMFGGVLLLGIGFLLYEVGRCCSVAMPDLMVVLRPGDDPPDELSAALRELRERLRGVGVAAEVQFVLCGEGLSEQRAAALRAVSEREGAALLPAEDIARTLQRAAGREAAPSE